MAPTLDELTVADTPDAWRACGFEVGGDTCVVSEVRIRLAGADAGRGLTGWSLRDVESAELDGLATARSDRPPPEERPAHPNGVTGLDHVVAITPDLERTVAALEAAGLDLRRIREEPTPAGAPCQAFFRLGGVILEVVQEPEDATERHGGDRPAFFWGLAFVSPDLDATVASLGDRVGEVRDAVQPGRRIATLRRSAGLALPVALMSPPAGGDQRSPASALSTGFRSRTGVPSSASSRRTRTRLPSISATSTRCRPIGLGRSGERVLNTPWGGRDRSPRGCTASTSRRARSSQVRTRRSSPASTPSSAASRSGAITSQASGAPSSPCSGAEAGSFNGDSTLPIGASSTRSSLTSRPYRDSEEGWVGRRGGPGGAGPRLRLRVP